MNWFRLHGPLALYDRILAMDVRGHGRGIRSEQRFTLEAAADDACALLEELDAGPAVVVGYSMGGSIALLMWRRHPESVAGLVLQSTALQWQAAFHERIRWDSMAVLEYVFSTATCGPRRRRTPIFAPCSRGSTPRRCGATRRPSPRPVAA